MLSVGIVQGSSRLVLVAGVVVCGVWVRLKGVA